MAGNQLLKNRSIREKLLISCIIITMVPLIILELVFAVQAKNTAFEREIKDAENLSERLIYNFENEMEKAELVVGTIAESSALRDFLTGSFSRSAEARDYYRQNISPMIAPHNSIGSGIRLKIYHNYTAKDVALEISENLDVFVAENFPYDPFTGESFWKSMDVYTFHPVISYFMPVKSSDYKMVDYVVSAHIKESYLYSYVSNEAPEERLMILTDKNGIILTSNLRGIIGSEFMPGEGSTSMVMDGRTYHVVPQKSENLNFYILLSDELLSRQANASIMKMLSVGLCLMVLSAWMISVITKRTTAGMSMLAEKMSTVDRGMIHTMAQDIPDEKSRDEVDQLDHAFTKMMHRIDDLVNTVQDDQKKLSEEIITRQQAELRFLQQQINPHYLFNTLESIRMNLVYKNDFENANIIKLFAESFRRYIDMTNGYSSLYEEMTFIAKYIQIQNYRLNNRISYNCREGGTAMAVRVPKLLVQPVVENAVIHGIESRADGGRIDVTIKIKEAKLLIIVEDDGVGMNEETLAELREHIRGDSGEGSIGLRNVYKRLKLVYGEQADMVVESKEGAGTKVTLIIPLSAERTE